MPGPFCRDCQDRDQLDVRLLVGNPTDGSVYRCVSCGWEGDHASWVTAAERQEMAERDAFLRERQQAERYFFGGRGPAGGSLEAQNSSSKKYGS
jgi:hypothetical protein